MESIGSAGPGKPWRVKAVRLALAALPTMAAMMAMTAALALPAAARLAPPIVDFDGSPSATAALPARLSATGLYADVAARTKRVSEAILPFEVNASLWSDGSRKERWITVPPGTQVIPTEKDKYVFPDKTVLIKNFLVDTVLGDSSSRILLETRFQVFRTADNQWHGISYKWNLQQTDADLVSQSAGEDRVVNVKTPAGRKGKRWHYPSKHECAACHVNRGALGFFTPQLDRPSKADPDLNQLADLFAKGILASNPVAGKDNSFRWVGITETGTGATLEAKSRSYLASNCSHCHGNGVFPGVQHDFDYFDPARKIGKDSEGGYVGLPTYQDPLFPRLVYAGYPESSYVLKRLLARGTFEARDVEQMPPLASFQPDSAAVGVIRDWICSLGSPPRPANACKLPKVQEEATYWDAPVPIHARPARPGSRQPLPGFYFQGRILRVPPTIGAGRDVRLLDSRGREIRLLPSGAGAFHLLSNPEPGVLILKAGSLAARLHWMGG